MTISKQQWLHDNAFKILDAVVDAIVTIDDRGIIQSVNAATARMFGYSDDEMLGQPLEMLMPEPYRTHHQRYVSRFLQSGVGNIIGIGRELQAVNKQGDTFPIYLAVSEICSEQGTYFAGIIRDLTAQKSDQQALIEQRERLARVGRLSTMGEMTASIAHEINQPLTAIAAYAQACTNLLDVPNLDERKLARIREAMHKLNTQSLRAGDIIERIQRFVRHEGSEKKLVDVNDLIRDLNHLASADAHSHSVELIFELQENLPAVYCDPVQIQQVALNLIRNAIDAMIEIECCHGRRIVLRTVRNHHRIEVSVEDLGTGVSEEQTALIFSPFHTTKTEGMGMGLSICKSIMQEHGGSLEFYNNPDKGCTFYFTLPIGDELG